MSEKEKEAIVEEQQQDISELLQIRRDKLAALQAEGNNPFFVNTCDKDISAQEIHDRFEELEGKDVCIAGRIMSWRDMGKASFMDIHDRSGRMQVYLRPISKCMSMTMNWTRMSGNASSSAAARNSGSAV